MVERLLINEDSILTIQNVKESQRIFMRIQMHATFVVTRIGDWYSLQLIRTLMIIFNPPKCIIQIARKEMKTK